MVTLGQVRCAECADGEVDWPASRRPKILVDIRLNQKEEELINGFCSTRQR